MDDYDIYELMMLAARSHPDIRNALALMYPPSPPPTPVHVDHYHCSCCGRIIVSEDETFRQTAGSSRSRASLEPPPIPRVVRRRFKHAEVSYSEHSENKPTGLRSTIGEVAKPSPPSKIVRSAKPGSSVQPAEPAKPDDTSKRLESSKLLKSAEPVETVQSGKAETPEKTSAATDQEIDPDPEEVKVGNTPQDVPKITPAPVYTEQKYWGTSNDTPTKPRIKTKLRRQSEATTPIIASTSESQDAVIADPIPSQPTTIAVSAASKDTLSRLFTSDPKNKKLLHVNEVVAALDDAGLTAKRGGKCSGSAVTFKHRGGQGTITFHCPHPDPKIEFHKQRTWGMRLANKFGWELDTFVVRN